MRWSRCHVSTQHRHWLKWCERMDRANRALPLSEATEKSDFSADALHESEVEENEAVVLQEEKKEGK